MPPGLDLAVFDLAVHSGPLRAVRLLQAVLGVEADGIVGPVTLGAALLIAAALSAALPPDRAALLAIRSKVLDILAYSGLGLAVVLLAVTITRGSLTVG